MTRRAGALNRFWVGLLGLVLLALGAGGLAVATGQASSLVGDGAPVPAPRDPVIPGLPAWVEHPVAVVAIGIGGLLLGVLALAWLLAQLPFTQSAAPYRISDHPAEGLTTVSARVLASAVADDVRALPGVEDADVVVRGTAAAPELVMTVTARTVADLSGLLDELTGGVVDRFGQAVDAPVRHVGVRLDLVREQTNADRLTIA